MKVLVTGGVGFLGSHVCEMGKKLGNDVTYIDNFNDYELKASGYKTVDSKKLNADILQELGVKCIRGDLRNLELLNKLPKYDYIIHTAAQPTVTLSMSDPRYDLENNVVATFNVLELARKWDIPISICSSVHTFGNNSNKTLINNPKSTRLISNKATFTENDGFLDGFVSPLHASKGCAEIYGRAFIDTYGLKVGIMRLGGMYGPRQFAGMNHGWVSNFISRMLKGLPLYIFGTEKQVRDILYCTDAAKLFYNYYESSRFRNVSGLYVIGGGLHCRTSLIDVINHVATNYKLKPNIVMKPQRDIDLFYFVSDNGKAYNQLAWEPKVFMAEGLEKTTNWIKENLALFEVTE